MFKQELNILEKKFFDLKANVNDISDLERKLSFLKDEITANIVVKITELLSRIERHKRYDVVNTLQQIFCKYTNILDALQQGFENLL